MDLIFTLAAGWIALYFAVSLFVMFLCYPGCALLWPTHRLKPRFTSWVYTITIVAVAIQSLYLAFLQ